MATTTTFSGAARGPLNLKSQAKFKAAGKGYYRRQQPYPGRE